MKIDKITKYTGISILTMAIMLSSNINNRETTKNTDNDTTTVYENDISFASPSNYHFEGSWKLVKNPNGLVDASFALEDGYHLEPYEYDNSLFYVVMDGYHNENGFLIPDGYHLENDKIIKDMRLSKTR